MTEAKVDLEQTSLEAYLSEATHEELSKYPAYNQQIQRFQARQQKERERQQRDESERAVTREARLKDSAERFAVFDGQPEQLRTYLEAHPDAMKSYAEVIAWRAGLQASQYLQGEMQGSILKRYRDVLEDMDELEGAPIDNWFSDAEDQASLMRMAVQYGTEKMVESKIDKLIQDAEKRIEDRLKAVTNQQRSAGYRDESPPPVPDVPVEDRAGLTRDDVEDMSPEYFIENEKAILKKMGL